MEACNLLSRFWRGKEKGGFFPPAKDADAAGCGTLIRR